MFRKVEASKGDDRPRYDPPPTGKSPMGQTQNSMGASMKTPDDRRKRFEETTKMIEAIEQNDEFKESNKIKEQIERKLKIVNFSKERSKSKNKDTKEQTPNITKVNRPSTGPSRPATGQTQSRP